MTYYNYHAIAKTLISSGHCIAVSIFARFRHINPALVLYFDNHRPIPIRQYRWHEYLPILSNLNIEINNVDNIPTD